MAADDEPHHRGPDTAGQSPMNDMPRETLDFGRDVFLPDPRIAIMQWDR